MTTLAHDIATIRPALAIETATIVFSDIHHFGAMTEKLGDWASWKLVREHAELVRELAEAHGGREILEMGDGFMLAFPSPEGALLCAIGLQRSLAYQSAEDLGLPIRVHIGLHTGEAIRDGEGYFGATVIEAKRYSDLARPDEILASESVRQSVRSGRVRVRFDRPRSVRLRGLSGPRRVYPVVWSDLLEA